MTAEHDVVAQHVAVIMDGNGRWAEAKGRPRIFGHRQGVETVRGIVQWSVRAGVKALTLYAFSTENWNRPAEEVTGLMTLLPQVIRRYAGELRDEGVRVRVIGDRSRLSERLRREIQEMERWDEADDPRLTVQVGIGYGGRWDIVRAAKSIVEQVQQGEVAVDDIDEEHVTNALSTSSLPLPDLLIRTGGDQRISNFLLWELAYAELFFTQTLWPDFEEEEFVSVLAQFKNRQRRFGERPDE